MNVSTIIKSALLSTAVIASSFSLAADIDANADANDLAIKGYDTVAYFTMNKPVMGSSRYSATYKNSIYHFTSAEHRDLFKTDSAKYAPQYGSFCAMGVAMGLKFDTDPTAWKIVDQKLYLNLSKDVQKAWLRDVPGNLQTAEQNWPTLKLLTPAQAKAKNG